MNHHPFTEWGIGHMSHPEDPTRCCAYPEDHYVHRPKYWREGEPITWPCYRCHFVPTPDGKCICREVES